VSLELSCAVVCRRAVWSLLRKKFETRSRLAKKTACNYCPFTKGIAYVRRVYSATEKRTKRTRARIKGKKHLLKKEAFSRRNALKIVTLLQMHYIAKMMVDCQ
jgi:hypothetical protein